MRFNRALLVPALALPALALAPAAPASADDIVIVQAGESSSAYMGPLEDLHPGVHDATDGATGSLFASTSGRGTVVLLALRGLSASDAGHRHGVHVHVGPCVAGEPAAAGPHFKVGSPPSSRTEIWLDLTVQSGGWGTSSAVVPFKIPPGGAASVVIHARPTARNGDAGARLACLPLDLG